MNRNYYNLFLLLSVLIFSIVLINRQLVKEKVVTVKIKERLIDVGKVVVNKKVSANFEILNTGTHDFLITQILSDCECTIPKKPKHPIKQNETGIIKVEYDNKNPGYFQRNITVLCNAKDAPIVLTLQGKTIIH